MLSLEKRHELGFDTVFAGRMAREAGRTSVTIDALPLIGTWPLLGEIALDALVLAQPLATLLARSDAFNGRTARLRMGHRFAGRIKTAICSISSGLSIASISPDGAR